MDKNELKVWEKLYNLATEIMAMEPQKIFSETDILTMKHDSFVNNIYFNILGQNEKRQGIVVYSSSCGIYGFNKMLTGYPVPREQFPRYQDSFAMFKANKDELINHDKVVLDAVYEESPENPFIFRRYEYKFCPAVFSVAEAEIMIKFLSALKYMIENYKADNIEMDFSNNMLCLYMDNNDNVKKLISKPKKVDYGDIPYLHITNENLMKKLSSAKKVNSKIEIDLCFLKKPISDVRFKKPYYARVLLMTDADKKSVIINEPINPIEDEYGCLITALVRYVENAGIPHVLFVRDGYMKRALYDTCKALGIMLIVSPKLAACDIITAKMNDELK